MAYVPTFVRGKPLFYDIAGPKFFNPIEGCGCCPGCQCFDHLDTGSGVWTISNPGDYAVSGSITIETAFSGVQTISGIFDWNASTSRWELQQFACEPDGENGLYLGVFGAFCSIAGGETIGRAFLGPSAFECFNGGINGPLQLVDATITGSTAAIEICNGGTQNITVDGNNHASAALIPA